MKPSMLAAALEFARRDYVVFPCSEKIPLTEHGFKDATRDEAQIAEWWAKWPSAQVALPTGKINKLFVLDLDSQEAQEFVKQWNLPETFTVETRQGRKQLWFRQSAELETKCSAEVLGPKIDTRGDGGYVIAPPSIHHETRAPYRVVKDIPCADASLLPAFVLRPEKHSDNCDKPQINGGMIPYGSHDSELTRIAGKLRHDGLEENAIMLALIEVCEKRCEDYGRDYKRMCAKIAHSVCHYPVRGGPRDTPGPQAEAVLHCFSDIAPISLRWLWPGRIPLGKLTLLIGDPGLGKSLLTADVASCVTRGTSFPDGQTCESGSVIFLSAEDDAADTIRPRLDAAGADVSRVHILEAVRMQLKDGSLIEKPFSLETDCAALEKSLGEHPDVRLIVIDPISAYLGGVDSHSNAEVRGVLAPLVALAGRLGVAVLCVTHLRKSAGAAIYRAISSIAFAAAARAVWAVASDPEDGDRRLLLAVKQNLSASAGGLAFRIETRDNVPCLAWEPGAIALAANDVLGNEELQERSERREAKEWLRDFLIDGPVAVKKIQAEAKAAGHSWITVRRAKEALPIVASKSGYQGKWEWKLEDVQLKGAHPVRKQVSTFEQRVENTNLNGVPTAKDAQYSDVSTFDAFEDDSEVRL